GLAREWNTQEPISWNISCPSAGNAFLDSLPRLKVLAERYQSVSDFEIFAKALNKNVCEEHNIDVFITPLEARHFLTIAFSIYALEQMRILKSHRAWPWYNWIKLHNNEIRSAISLNYDLLLESIFDDLKKQYFSLQINHHGYGIPLVKPHGSVDFEIAPNSISYSASYPLTNFVDLNDSQIIRLDRDNLVYPRSQPLCIIPNEASKYTNYQWVARANKLFNEELVVCTHCVFIGISYFPCDRPEIDAIIESLPKSAQIIVANPNPPAEFMEKIKGRPVLVWDSYDGPVDKNGNLLVLKNIKTGNKLVNCFCGSGLSYHYCCGDQLL
ncbi:hypothetical protein H5185_19200, partial [Shewanella sp. SG44-6]